MDSLQDGAADAGSLAVLSQFWLDFHACLTARTDELCELADAVLCAGGPVRSLAGLSLAAEHQRGHGALYDAVYHRRIDVMRLQGAVSAAAEPRRQVDEFCRQDESAPVQTRTLGRGRS